MPRYLVPDVPYCRQSEATYCGSACSEMVLEARQTSPPSQSALKQQADLVSTLSTFGGGLTWYSSPEGLLGSLQHFNGSTYPTFSLLEECTADGLARKMATAICQYSDAKPTAPPIALVFGPLHWVVVIACEIDDHTNTIRSFTILNPAPNTTNPHTFERSPIHIVYSWWKKCYSTGIRHQGSPLFLAVSTPQSLAGCQFATPPETGVSSSGLISAEQAKQAAVDGFTEHGLYDTPPWKEVLQGSSPGKPYLISSMKRSDLPWNGIPYYLVPINSSDGWMVVEALVDAKGGGYGEARLVPMPNTSPWNSFPSRTDVRLRSTEEVRATLMGKTIHPPGDFLEGIHLNDTNFEVEEGLVWQPNAASFSPYHPFHRVDLLTENREHFFVGTQIVLDGQRESFPIFMDIPGMYQQGGLD